MKKPLRGRRSGPLWFLILMIIGSSVYGVYTYLPLVQMLAVSFMPWGSTVSVLPQMAATHQQAALIGTATTPALPIATPTPAAVAGNAAGATSTPTPSATPTLTPTPAPDFYQMITDFRRAERAALQTLDPNVLAQVPVFAHGEALAALQQQVETLRAAGQYEVFIVENIQVEQVLPGAVAGVLVSERHSRQTFERAAGGDRLLNQEVNNVSVVYGFVEDSGRWKIDKVRVTNPP